MSMKKRGAALIILPVLALILQILPYGAVLNFANPEGEPFRRAYSYFSLVPFGYANFGPLITAILTCVLMLLIFIVIFKYNDTVYGAAQLISAIAFFASVTPIFYGLQNISVIGIVISVALCAHTVLMTIIKKTYKKDYK